MSGEVNCGYWNGDLLFFFFSYRIHGIQVAYTWRWVFCEKARAEAKGKPSISHVLLPDGTRGGERERMEMKLSWIS